MLIDKVFDRLDVHRNYKKSFQFTEVSGFDRYWFTQATLFIIALFVCVSDCQVVSTSTLQVQ